MPMAGFKFGSSGVLRKNSVNRATSTTLHVTQLIFTQCLLFN